LGLSGLTQVAATGCVPWNNMSSIVWRSIAISSALRTRTSASNGFSFLRSLPIRPVLTLGQTVFQGRKLGAEKAGVLPVGVERCDRPNREAQRIGAHDFRVDIGVQAGGKLRNADV
jgi:hypothetical protein